MGVWQRGVEVKCGGGSGGNIIFKSLSKIHDLNLLFIPFLGSVICEDKNAEGLCEPQFKWGCNRFPWFQEDCQKLCGKC